jgi:hypothetical protein
MNILTVILRILSGTPLLDQLRLRRRHPPLHLVLNVQSGHLPR